MNEDQVAGAGKEIAGKIEEGAGRLTGNARLEAEGDLDQLKGKVQRVYGEVRDGVADLAAVAKENASEAAVAAMDIASEANDWARDKMENRPYASAAVFFTFGMFAGLAALASR